MDDIAVIATTDHQLRDAALRWCAAAGAGPVVVDSVDSARREWRNAAIVFIGQDMVADVMGARAPRRDHVVVLAREPEAVWRPAMALGASAVVDPLDDTAALAAVGAALDG